MLPPDNDDTVLSERYVTSAADLLHLDLNPEWIPAIARNVQLLLAAARATEVAGSDQTDGILRFEP